jgi:hypothetical protein
MGREEVDWNGWTEQTVGASHRSAEAEHAGTLQKRIEDGHSSSTTSPSRQARPHEVSARLKE